MSTTYRIFSPATDHPIPQNWTHLPSAIAFAGGIFAGLIARHGEAERLIVSVMDTAGTVFAAFQYDPEGLDDEEVGR